MCVLTGVLYFVSATVNPILYCVMSKKYRKAFKDTLCKSCCYKACRKTQLLGRGLSASTTYTLHTSSARRTAARTVPNHYESTAGSLRGSNTESQRLLHQTLLRSTLDAKSERNAGDKNGAAGTSQLNGTVSSAALALNGDARTARVSFQSDSAPPHHDETVELLPLASGNTPTPV